MSGRTKTGLKWLLGLVLGGFFVWLSAAEWPMDRLFGHGVHLDGTVLHAGTWSFDLFYLLPYLGILTAIHFLRVIRWYPLLRPLADVDFWRLNRVSAVGFMYLFILPFRLGELARPYLIADKGVSPNSTTRSGPRSPSGTGAPLSRRTTSTTPSRSRYRSPVPLGARGPEQAAPFRDTPKDITMTGALGTVVVERVVDGLIVSLVLFVVLFYLPGQGESAFTEIRLGAYAALLLFGGSLTVLVAMYLRRDWTLRVLRLMLGRISRGLADKIITLLATFYAGLAALPNARYFASFTAWSLVYWGLNGYGYYVLALGFPDLDIPLLAAYAMMCCVVVGMMLPNPPANVGVYWYFLLKPMALYGVAAGEPAALAFGLLAWAGQFVQQGAFGLWFLARGESYRPVPAEVHAEAETA